MTDVPTGICRHCKGPAPLDDRGLIDRHREQILGAHGWVNGYDNCRGKGSRPVREVPDAP